jgi:hypothetical protein
MSKSNPQDASESIPRLNHNLVIRTPVLIRYEIAEIHNARNSHPELTPQQIALMEQRLALLEAELAEWVAHSRFGDGLGSQPLDKLLYAEVKKYADSVYKKPSAYKSGFIVKTYKERGGKYSGVGERPLARWFKEDWQDVGNQSYPVYRPTKRVTKDTPLLPSEIDPTNLKKQIQRKQKIKGERNLEPFIAR